MKKQYYESSASAKSRKMAYTYLLFHLMTIPFIIWFSLFPAYTTQTPRVETPLPEIDNEPQLEILEFDNGTRLYKLHLYDTLHFSSAVSIAVAGFGVTSLLWISSWSYNSALRFNEIHEKNRELEISIKKAISSLEKESRKWRWLVAPTRNPFSRFTRNRPPRRTRYHLYESVFFR